MVLKPAEQPLDFVAAQVAWERPPILHSLSASVCTTRYAPELSISAYTDPKTKEGVSHMAVISDSQGAAFAIFQPMARE
jgi:hypothetical protein